MNDRPKRERKPTSFFQYRDTSGESTIANAGGASSRRKSTTEAPSTSRIKSEDAESPNRRTSRSRGRSPGRSRGRGASGRGGLRRSCTGKSHRRSLTLDADEQTDDGTSAFLSDPIDDEGALLNDNDDSDLEGNGNKASESSAGRVRKSLKPPSGRKVPAKGNVVSKLRTDGDEVIEQWYADPYERVNPNDVAYDQWRSRNLQISLQNQGYSIVNSKQMAAWLMKCNGHFMEFNAPVKKSRAKKSRQTATETDDNALHRTVVSDVGVHQDDEDENHGTGDHVMEDSEQNLKQSESDATFAAFKTAMSSRQMYSELTLQGSNASAQQRTESVSSNRLSTPSLIKPESDAMDINHEDDADEEEDQDGDIIDTQSKKTPKLSDKYELENLKRCLNVFNAVYGPQGPRGNPAKFELNHFSNTSALPVLIPKAGLRTQAHYALQEVRLPADNPAFFNGIKDLSLNDPEQSTSQDERTKKFRKVLTEDPDFGLTIIPKSEAATEADMKLYYAQFARAKNIGQGKITSVSDKEWDTQENESDMDKEERQALIKESNRESANLISEQLKQPLFDWETPFTMAGEVPKSIKDDKMRRGALAIEERHVWKEIRRRQEILDEGGEEAAKLLEQEWEDAQQEIKREERRRQNAQLKARKRAAYEAGVSERDGRRKRVKFSEWVAEE